MPTTFQSYYSGVKLEPLYEAQNAPLMNVNLPASVSYARGTILGEVTATPGTYKAYASGNTDGSQNPACILAYDVQTDASANITFSATAGQVGDTQGVQYPCAPAYMAGTFQTADLVQSGAGSIDANAVAKLGHLVEGTTAAGILRIG